MKNLVIVSFSLMMMSCQPQKEKQNNQLQKETESYTPGFGEMMSSIQHHHIKLWFAGLNNNWELAKFEIHEIDEVFEDIENYKKDKAETQQIPMIKPSIKNMESIVKNKDSLNFEKGFTQLTNNCNNCHIATEHRFIKIKIPTNNPFSNQEFEIKE